MAGEQTFLAAGAKSTVCKTSRPFFRPARCARRGRVLYYILAFPLLITAGWFTWRQVGSFNGPPTLAIEQPSHGRVENQSKQPVAVDGMLRLSGGEFVQGRDRHAADCGPARRIRLSAFEIDQYEVTNKRFQEFVKETSYVTIAERRGFGWVFDSDRRAVRQMNGASWLAPQGATSTIVGRENMPVVQVSYIDAQAFASWDGGKRLPTEAEYEYAAGGGHFDQDYPWGGRVLDARQQHNIWLGAFPHKPSLKDGYRQLAPVGSYPANDFGLFDATGNVREWCSDWYRDDYYQVGPSDNPQGPSSGGERVVRGGSWLSTPDSLAATIWRRAHLPPDFSDDQTGFRTAKDVE